MRTVTAVHRIISDDCRRRTEAVVILETLESIEKGIKDALKGYPPDQGTKIHAKVEIEIE